MATFDKNLSNAWQRNWNRMNSSEGSWYKEYIDGGYDKRMSFPEFKKMKRKKARKKS